MKTDEVLDLIKRGRSVEDIVLSDLAEKRLKFKEAMLLVEHGFIVSPENILYRDSDIAYDPDFDEVEWESDYGNLREFLESKNLTNPADSDTITIELSIKDQGMREWLDKHESKLKEVVKKMVVDLYNTEQLLHSK